ncbi:hypothetical protein IW262DRAFT_1462537 [Armillaria fumosa]|nr:hypothetical protein IW262DRAFT_1462537 [Armillaria fumosa]
MMMTSYCQSQTPEPYVTLPTPDNIDPDKLEAFYDDRDAEDKAYRLAIEAHENWKVEKCKAEKAVELAKKEAWRLEEERLAKEAQEKWLEEAKQERLREIAEATGRQKELDMLLKPMEDEDSTNSTDGDNEDPKTKARKELAESRRKRKGKGKELVVMPLKKQKSFVTCHYRAHHRMEFYHLRGRHTEWGLWKKFLKGAEEYLVEDSDGELDEEEIRESMLPGSGSVGIVELDAMTLEEEGHLDGEVEEVGKSADA